MSLFPRPQQTPPSNGIFARLSEVRRMMNGNPQAMYQSLMQGNPQFAEFVRSNQGKTPEQIAQENGIDYGIVKRFMG